MADTLDVSPSTKPLEHGIVNTKVIANALGNAVSDTYHLMFKSQAYHWNVEGPLFLTVHKLTEEHYENLFAAVDELAERIRALGQLAPTNLKSIIDASLLDEPESSPTAGDMVKDLAEDHLKVAGRMHELAKLAGDNNDIVTEDMAVARAGFHEQAAWMLRATATQ